MRKLVVLAALVAALAVPAGATAHSGTAFSSFNGGLPGGDYDLSASEHHWLFGVSGIRNIHGGLLRWGSLKWFGGNNATYGYLTYGARMKDNALLYIRVYFAKISSTQAAYDVSAWHQ
jgi:hypothetical protein